jgi:hypothetical protein
MNSTQSKSLQLLHLILGFFFTIAGILTLFKVDYLFSVWIISFGLLFLFYTTKDVLKLRVKPVILEIMHYLLALIVLMTGIFTLLIDFELL